MGSCWKCVIKLENALYHTVVRLRKELIPREVCTLEFPFVAPVLCGNDVIMHLCASHWPGRTEQNWKGKQDSQGLEFTLQKTKMRFVNFSPADEFSPGQGQNQTVTKAGPLVNRSITVNDSD